jgi:hypothetical protein
MCNSGWNFKDFGFYIHDQVRHSAILRSAPTVYLCVLCRSENKQRLFRYTALTGGNVTADVTCIMGQGQWILQWKGFPQSRQDLTIHIAVSIINFYSHKKNRSDGTSRLKYESC